MSSLKMKKVAAVIALILAVLLLLPMVVTIFAGTASAITQAEIDALKEKAEELKEKNDQVKKELDAVRANKESAVAEKNALDSQIAILQEQIDVSTSIIEELNAEISQKEIEIDEAEEEEAEEYELFKQRVRVMEENQSASYIGILLNAESFEEMLSRVEIINDIIEYDRDLMAKLKEIRESIEQAKAELEQTRIEENAARDELEQQQAELQIKYEEQSEFVSKLEADEAAYLAAYAEVDADLEQVNKDIEEANAEMQRQIEENLRKQKEAEEAAKKQNAGSAYMSDMCAWPSYTTYITSDFGMRWHPVTKEYRLHTGTDIGASSGTDIWAALSGTVTISTYSSSYGNYVVINHGNGYSTLYAHMSKRLVEKGDYVSTGDVIGLVGSTGWSTGPHLHFEIIANGEKVDPMTYFN